MGEIAACSAKRSLSETTKMPVASFDQIVSIIALILPFIVMWQDSISHEQASIYQADAHLRNYITCLCQTVICQQSNSHPGHKNGEENKQTNSSAFHVTHDNVKNKQFWQWNVIHLRAFLFFF